MTDHIADEKRPALYLQEQIDHIFYVWNSSAKCWIMRGPFQSEEAGNTAIAVDTPSTTPIRYIRLALPIPRTESC